MVLRSDDKRVCVIMPAYNEAGSVGKVIAQVRQEAPGVDIVVINDGSRDETQAVAEQAGGNVLTLPFNLGIGGAVQTGLKWAYQKGYDVAVEVDADGQHDPAYISRLVETVVKEKIDMAIGSRFVIDTTYRSSWLRLIGIRIFSQLIKLVTGTKIYDSTSGYRAYSRNAIQFLSRRYPADFPEPESIVMLLNAGFSLKEVPVAMSHRWAGESVVGRSDVSSRAAYFVLSNAIAILVSSLKVKRSHAN